MKIRTGFVSNSSSSSFIIGVKNKDIDKKYNELLELFNDVKTELYGSENDLIQYIDELNSISKSFNFRLNDFEPEYENDRLTIKIKKNTIAKYFSINSEIIKSLNDDKNARKEFICELIQDEFFTFGKDEKNIIDFFIKNHDNSKITFDDINKLKILHELFIDEHYHKLTKSLCFFDLYKINDNINRLNNVTYESIIKIFEKLFNTCIEKTQSDYDVIKKTLLYNYYKSEIDEHFNLIKIHNKKLFDLILKELESIKKKIQELINKRKDDMKHNHELFSLIRDLDDVRYNYLFKNDSEVLKSICKAYDTMLDDTKNFTKNELAKKIIEVIQKNIVKDLSYFDKYKKIYDIGLQYNEFIEIYTQGSGDGWDNLISNGLYESSEDFRNEKFFDRVITIDY